MSARLAVSIRLPVVHLPAVLKPRIKLAESNTPDGGTLALFEHDGAFSIFLDGKELMHSKVSASEELLGQVGVKHIDHGQAGRVLIGGLGLGFTLRSVLEALGSAGQVEVVELLPAVIEWNRTHMRELNGMCLDDSRVRTLNEDVSKLIRETSADSYDAILLDVDNGPVAMVARGNASLYTDDGIESLLRALKPGGRLAIWSAGKDQKFENRLRKSRIQFEAIPAKVHKGAKRSALVIYVIANG